MTDHEAVRLCAEAMGYRTEVAGDWLLVWDGENGAKFDPLHDDAQALALVKRFGVWITTYKDEGWLAQVGSKALKDADLNRAIVFCVAQAQRAKGE